MLIRSPLLFSTLGLAVSRQGQVGGMETLSEGLGLMEVFISVTVLYKIN